MLLDCIFFGTLVHMILLPYVFSFAYSRLGAETGYNAREMVGLTMLHIPQNRIILKSTDLVHDHAAADTFQEG